jgi:hypothetical protein
MKTDKYHVIALLLICLPPTAGAEGAHVLHYTARLHGVPLLDISYCLALGPSSYASSISARTLGLVEMLVHGRSEGHAAGAIEGVRVKPAAYEETGRLSGEDHSVAIGYKNGDPVLRHMEPPLEKYRLPIPPGDLAGAVDGLSAVALESLVATRSGACQGQALVYDGFQLRRATTRTAGIEVLKPNARSIFSGPALRCDTASEMLAGYLKDKPVPPQARPRFSTAWLGRLSPGGPMLPLKLSFDADFLGDIIVDLDRAGEQPGC